MTHTPKIFKSYLLIALNLVFSNSKTVLDGTGITLESLSNLDAMDVKHVIELINSTKKHSNNPVWPTTLGAHLGAACHGPVGYATLSAKTVGDALTTFVRWFKVRCETYSERIVSASDHYEIVIIDTTHDTDFQEIFFESFVRAFEVLIEQIIGHLPDRITEIHFLSHAKDRRELLENEYISRLSFGCDANKMIVPLEIWELPSPLYDQDSFEFNIRKCQQLQKDNESVERMDLKIRKIIRTHFEEMMVSSNVSITPPTLTTLCSTVHVTERTLIRKLKEHETSYKLILEEERKCLAEQLLKNDRYSISDIADLLGYKESANFCRAFRRWTGMSPTDYRHIPSI